MNEEYKLDFTNYILDNIITNTDDCDINYLMINFNDNMNYILNNELEYFGPTWRERFKILFVDRFIEGKTLEEMGRILKVTRERVRQLERKFIYLLKRPMYQDILKFGPDYAKEKYKQTELLKKISEYNQLLEFEIYKKEKQAEENCVNTDLMLPVRKFGLSTRSSNCLRRAGIEYLGDLLNKTEFDLMKIRNLGKEALKEITNFLESKGYKLRSESNEELD